MALRHTPVFEAGCRPFSGTFLMEWEARLELAKTGFADRRFDHFSISHMAPRG